MANSSERSVAVQTLELFNTLTASSDKPCIQYIADDGKIARRGYWSGGFHLWEKLESQGAEHFCVGPVPLLEGNYSGNGSGLREGKSYREYDELRASLLRMEKLQPHWKSSVLGQHTEFYKAVEWNGEVLCAWHNGATLLLDKSGAHLTEDVGMPETAQCLYFTLHSALAGILKEAQTLNVNWFADHIHATLTFDFHNFGGVILGWDITKPTKELIETNYKNEPYRYRRVGNQITKENEMKVNGIPAVPKAEIEEKKDAKPTTLKELVAPVAEETKVPAKETAPEAAQEPAQATEPSIEEQLEAAFNKAETLKTLATELVKELKPLIKAVNKIRKEAGNSAEVKTLKAENKELAAKVKATEKELAAKTQALKLLVSNEKF